MSLLSNPEPIQKPTCGYFDIPICDEYSNIEVRDNPIKTNEYRLNEVISKTVNDNHGKYVVYQDPTIPSASLSIESDQSFAGYYNKNPMNLSYESPLIRKKEDSKKYDFINTDRNPSLGIESFQNQGHTFVKTVLSALAIFLLVLLLVHLNYL